MGAQTDIQRRLCRPRQAPVLIGVTIAALLVSIGVYAYFAPLAKGVIAHGQVTVMSKRKVVQHESGGTIEAILVGEGDRVQKGQPLLRFDTKPLSLRLEQLTEKRDDLLARRGMLRAIIDQEREITHDDSLIARSEDPVVVQLLFDYNQALASTWQEYDGQVTQHRMNISNLHARIPRLEARKENLQADLSLIQKELERQTQLRKQHLSVEKEVQASRRAELSARRSIVQLEGEIAATQEEIESEEQSIRQLLVNLVNKASNEIVSVQSEISSIRGELNVLHDRIDRSEVTAPHGGVIINLQVHTIGGVVTSGQAIMEIVPPDVLEIEAGVTPADIDNVHRNQKVRVRFTAFPPRNVPDLLGAVTEVSADSVALEGQQPHFVARVTLNEGEAERIAPHTIVPGMTAEVLFEGEERTVFDYFMGGFADAWRTTMLEE